MEYRKKETEMIARLVESMLVRDTGFLEKFLDEKCPREASEKNSIMKNVLPHEIVKHGKDDRITYYYPDGKRSGWFVLGDFLFISGTVNEYGNTMCFVRMYQIEKDGGLKTMSRVAFYGDPDTIGKEKNLSSEKKKLLSNFMRKLMKTASSFSSDMQAQSFLQGEAQKEFYKRQGIPL